MLLEMQRIEWRRKISRHRPLFHGTCYILEEEIHFFSDQLFFGTWNFSFPSGDLHSHLFRITHDLDKKTPWQRQVFNLDRVLMLM